MILSELQLTSALLRFSCHLGRARLAALQCKTVHVPLDVRHKLAGELSGCIAEYDRLWRLRSRVGGLPDSMQRLEALKELLLS